MGDVARIFFLEAQGTRGGGEVLRQIKEYFKKEMVQSRGVSLDFFFSVLANGATE